jgi:hypothetical protein
MKHTWNIFFSSVWFFCFIAAHLQELEPTLRNQKEYPAAVVNKPAVQTEVAVIDTIPVKQIVTDCVESICFD